MLATNTSPQTAPRIDVIYIDHATSRFVIVGATGATSPQVRRVPNLTEERLIV